MWCRAAPRDDLSPGRFNGAAGSLGGSRLLRLTDALARSTTDSSQGNRGDDDWQVEAVGDRIRRRSSAHC